MRHFALTLSLFLFALFAGCGKDDLTQDLVKKAAVETVDLRDVVVQVGVVQPIVKVDIKPECSGRIDTLYLREGQRVRKGERILKIDPTQMITQKNKLDISLEKTKINATIAKRDYENGQAILATGSLSKQKLDDLKNQYDLAELEVKDIQLDLNDLEYKLSKTTIVSPMNGVIIAMPVEVGEIAVSATSGFSGGTLIGTVADISRLEIITQIGEVDYDKIKMGQTVSIRLESDSKRNATGKVTFIALSAKTDANSTVSNFEVRASIDSVIPGLTPGVNVNADFVVLQKPKVTGVPYNMVEKSKEKGKETYIVYRPSGTVIPPQYAAEPPEKEEKKGGRRPPGGGAKMDARIQKTNAERQAAIKKLDLIPQRIVVGATDYKYYEVLEGLSPGDTVARILGGLNP
ncbi:MAG: efflux RND transporter periplasmic adaptor subunit [Fibrobacterota bacterium]